MEREEELVRIDYTATIVGNAQWRMETGESIVNTIWEGKEKKTVGVPLDPGTRTTEHTNTPEMFQGNRMGGTCIMGPPIGLALKTTIWHLEKLFTERLPV